MPTPIGSPRRSFPVVSTSSALVLALLAAGCGKKGAASGGFHMPPTPVEVAEVRAQTVRDQFHALGNLSSQDQIDVVSELNATVVDLPFDEGQSVDSGSLIAKLDDREYQAASEHADAARDQAKSNYERAKTLLAQNAIPQQSLDDAGTALKIADADAALARARYDKTRIRAPFAGVIGRRLVSKGAYLQSGTVITQLARIDEMKVSFSVPERYLPLLKVGVPVDVQTPAFPGEHFPGRISVVDPLIDRQTRTVQLVARIPNPSRRLRPGMSADVSVTFSERDGALVVPDEAVFAQGNQSFVFVVSDSNTVSLAPVMLGTRDSSRVEIVHGLAAGQKIVRTGHQKLYPGAKVMPVGADVPGAPTAKAGT